jgi:phosphatidylinositol transfer protein SFH5
MSSEGPKDSTKLTDSVDPVETEPPTSQGNASAVEASDQQKTDTEPTGSKSPEENAEIEGGRPRRSTQVGNPPTLEAPPYVPADGPVWPEIDASHPLFKFEESLKSILDDAGYSEIYGIQLDRSGEFHSKLILQKFLRANANDIEAAKKQLLATLKWRKEFQPLKCVNQVHSQAKFEGLGYVVMLDGIPGSANKNDVVTFNIYGAVKDPKFTFEDIEAFLQWRVGLMELGIQKLDLAGAKTPIPDYGKGPDPYQGVQVHDYLNVSFLRMDPYAKAASGKTIELFKQYYPETLSRKFFVNVPRVMGWMFGAVKLVLSKETIQKFTVLTFGKELAGELGDGVPEEYGGKAGSLEGLGETLKTEAKGDERSGEKK